MLVPFGSRPRKGAYLEEQHPTTCTSELIISNLENLNLLEQGG